MTTDAEKKRQLGLDILAEIKAEEDSFNAIVQPGDILFSRNSKTYTFSGFQYKTKGKGYKVIERNSAHFDSFLTETDMVGEKDYVGALDTTHVIRDGKIIWDSRKKVKFSYSLKYAESLAPGEQDCYGQEVDLSGMWEGYVIDHYYPLEAEDRHAESFLVELITSHRGGQPGEKTIIACKMYNVVYC